MRVVRRRGPLVLALAVTMVSFLPGMGTPRAAAAEYELDTRAAYDVHPDEGLIDVGVAASFTNTTPDP